MTTVTYAVGLFCNPLAQFFQENVDGWRGVIRQTSRQQKR